MRRAALFAAVAAAVAWFLSPDLHWLARGWVAFLLAGMPLLTVWQARELRNVESLPRRAAYASSMASLWILAGLTAGTAWGSGMSLSGMGLAGLPLPVLLVWTGGLTLAGILIIALFWLAGFRETPLVRELIPVSASDRGWFVALSATAGITEEFVFRGFLIHALVIATGSPVLALVLSSGVFGVVHAYQQPVGALRATVLGACLALPLILHGSILPAILAHAAIDVAAGLWLARYLVR
ncbi:MAG TPA: CPBP family intramembrane glutamic endopeptidase [Longimicrobiales bacterium]|nr:CPBP family intramembrane glutamic endopeptidase [Longimicrobiales bacterium]